MQAIFKNPLPRADLGKQYKIRTLIKTKKTESGTKTL